MVSFDVGTIATSETSCNHRSRTLLFDHDGHFARARLDQGFRRTVRFRKLAAYLRTRYRPRKVARVHRRRTVSKFRSCLLAYRPAIPCDPNIAGFHSPGREGKIDFFFEISFWHP